MLKTLLATLFLLFLSITEVPAADLSLVDPAAVSGRLSEWVVLDARPRKEYAAGHLPGARSLCWEDFTHTGGGENLLAPREIAPLLPRLGIDEKTPVLIYGDADTSFGGEGWVAWVLSSLGHKAPIRVVAGGIQAWRGKGLPLVRGGEPAAARKAQYRVDLRPQLDVSAEEIEAQKGKVSLVDVRSTLEWLRGRIPGAVHIPWQEFFTGKDRHPLPPAQLKQLLARHGVDTSRPVVYYCAIGVRSSYAWLVHHLSGLPEARSYGGGMEGWRRAGH